MNKLLKRIVVSRVAQQNKVYADSLQVEIDLVEHCKNNPGEIHRKVDGCWVDILPLPSGISLRVAGKDWSQECIIQPTEGRPSLPLDIFEKNSELKEQIAKEHAEQETLKDLINLRWLQSKHTTQHISHIWTAIDPQSVHDFIDEYANLMDTMLKNKYVDGLFKENLPIATFQYGYETYRFSRNQMRINGVQKDYLQFM